MKPSNFWYIKLRDWGDRGNKKMPAESWGGYDTDFSENENVYSFEQTKEENHSSWGIVGHRSNCQIVVIDADIHKLDDFEDDDIQFSPDRTGIIKSHSEERDQHGLHFYVLVEPDIDIKSTKSFIDIKGNQKGHVVSPWHSDYYEITNDPILKSFKTITSLNDSFGYEYETVLTSKNQYSGKDIDLDIPDESPSDLPSCLEKLLEARMNVPRDGSYQNPWRLDSAVGRRLVGFGYSKAESMSLLNDYPPQDGYDETESSYQMDQLYKKQLQPDSTESLEELGIEVDCGCQFCDNESIIEANPVSADDWSVQRTDGELPNVIMPSTARTGKSYTMIKEAAKLIEDERVVYLSSAHSEARASYEKCIKHGLTDSAYLVGKNRARREYGVVTDTDKPYNDSFQPRTPEQAAKRDDINAYRAYQETAEAAQVVVTVPEKLESVGDRDWVIMTEEAAFSRMLSQSISVLDIEMYNSNRVQIKKSFHDFSSSAQVVRDRLDKMDTDGRHDPYISVINAIDNIINTIDDWMKLTWEEVKETWDELVSDIRRIIDEIVIPEEFTIEEAFRWLDDEKMVRNDFLNLMFADGVKTYSNEQRKQMFIVGDVEKVFTPLPDSLNTVWTAGNSVPHMEHFHELTHGGEYDIKPFAGGKTPVQESIRVLKYTGGDNPNVQANRVQRSIEQLQNVDADASGLLISGSSQYCASHAKRIRKCTTPSQHDDLDSIKDYQDANMVLAIPENSQYSEGVDTPGFDFGALYNGRFATPREDYIKDKYGDRSLKKAEKIRAAQNSILRPSDVPDGNGTKGTGLTPVIVPDMHVPDEIWTLFEEYGIKVYEDDDVSDIRRSLVAFINSDKPKVQDGQIIDSTEIETVRPFEELRRRADSEDRSAG